jgi:hypothetical protein
VSGRAASWPLTELNTGVTVAGMRLIERERRMEPEAPRRERGPPADALRAMLSGAGNAALARRLARPTVQRFAELEHKAIGDRAAGDVQFRIAPTGRLHLDDVNITYGDLVAMGDYFTTPDEITSLTATPGLSKNTIGEVYYTLYVKIRGQSEGPLVGKKFDATAKEAVEERFLKLAASNVSHFPNPGSGDVDQDPRTKAKRHDGPALTGEPATYRDGHVRAVRRAVELARAGHPVGGALAIDAFYSHFLTDAFSAGHIRTPRVTVVNYWNTRVPDFNARFVAWLGDKLGFFISHTGSQLEQAAPRGTVRSGARDAVKEALKQKPPLSFGDVIGGALHDFDSQRGVVVTIGGKKMRMVGDGHLLDREGDDDAATHKAAATTMDIAVKAVQSSRRDVERAYDMGAAGSDLDAVLAALTKEGKGLFLPERLVPEPVPDDQLTDADKALMWVFKDTDDLLKDKRMRRALTLFANNKAGMFDAIMDDPKIEEVAKQGLRLLVQEPMRSSDTNTTIGLFRDILAHAP